MYITVDKNNYIENYAIIGLIENGIETEDITDQEELALFQQYPSAFKFTDNTFTLDNEKLEELKREEESSFLTRMYIPNGAKSSLELFRILLNTTELSEENKMRVSGLYLTWEPGKYKVGDIRNYNGQTWECFQAHDNSVYPDINPNNAAWFTFWRPLHGKSSETARPFVPVKGAHDMYHTGEYAYFNGKLYKCIQDTAYSPEDYDRAWQEEE